MELPALKLPAIQLPFDIPTLLHPPVDHFAIAIPILVLIIEIINLFAKKRAIGVISFVLLLIGMVAVAGAYFTGTVDGKEAFDALTQAGQAELKEHKLLGTYLLLASAVVVLFKLLSAMIRKGLVKMLYLLILVIFVAGILKQGKDGGELVYEYGANVERVQELDSEVFDLNEELDELKEEMESASKAVEEKVQEVKDSASEAVENVAEKSAEVVEKAKEETKKAADAAKEVAAEAVETAKEKSAEVVDAAKEAAHEAVKSVTPQIEQVHQSVAQPETAAH